MNGLAELSLLSHTRGVVGDIVNLLGTKEGRSAVRVKELSRACRGRSVESEARADDAALR